MEAAPPASGNLILLWNPPSKNPGYAPEKPYIKASQVFDLDQLYHSRCKISSY